VATKDAEGSYVITTSAVTTISISDSDVLAEVAANKAAAEKAAAEKVIADAIAAARAAADRAAADAAAQPAEGGGGAAPAVLSTINTITVTAVKSTVAQKIKVNLNLSYKYASKVATVQFGTKSVVNGKTVWKFADFTTATLNTNGNAIITKSVTLKSSLLLKVGMQVRTLVNKVVIKAITISKL
jgi:hypothetical protein